MLFPTLALIVAALLFFIFVRPALSLAPWVPTRKEDYEKINQLANLSHSQKFYELGCGDGRVAQYIATQNPQAQIIGIELSPLLFCLAYARKLFGRHDNWSVQFWDAMNADLRDANVVYAFALPHTVKQKLVPKLEQELHPGSRFISYAFEIAGTDQKVTTFKGESHTIFLIKF